MLLILSLLTLATATSGSKVLGTDSGNTVSKFMTFQLTGFQNVGPFRWIKLVEPVLELTTVTFWSALWRPNDCMAINEVKQWSSCCSVYAFTCNDDRIPQ